MPLTGNNSTHISTPHCDSDSLVCRTAVIDTEYGKEVAVVLGRCNRSLPGYSPVNSHISIIRIAVDQKNPTLMLIHAHKLIKKKMNSATILPVKI